jgi:hypothetical protein
MRKVTLISAIIFFGTFLSTVTAWSSCMSDIYGKTYCPPKDVSCRNDLYGRIVCSPPYGDIVMTINGQMLCGPGKCMITPFGQAFCSSEQGGSVALGSKGEPVCTGSCVPASAEACNWQ